jgi:hypothetical protein
MTDNSLEQTDREVLIDELSDDVPEASSATFGASTCWRS